MRKPKRNLIGLWDEKKLTDTAPSNGVWNYISTVRLYREFVK